MWNFYFPNAMLFVKWISYAHMLSILIWHYLFIFKWDMFLKILFFFLFISSVALHTLPQYDIFLVCTFRSRSAKFRTAVSITGPTEVFFWSTTGPRAVHRLRAILADMNKYISNYSQEIHNVFDDSDDEPPRKLFFRLLSLFH